MGASRPIYKPEYWDMVKQFDANANEEDPSNNCMPAGVPRVGSPSYIGQFPNYLIFIYPGQGGLIATFVSLASIVTDMPRVLVGLAKQHHTWEIVDAGGAFALHLLGERHVEWVWSFGLSSGRDGDKFLGLAVRQGVTNSPLLDDALGWLDCKVEATLDTGDRTVYLAEVIDGVVQQSRP